jgi:quercetin dioxygenase-like cupin family protein
MLSHLEPFLLMPSALTTTALRERAEQLAAAPELQDALSRLGDQPIRVRHTPLYDAWLLPWAPDSSTDLHVHDAAHGVITVLDGTLREAVTSESGVEERAVATGQAIGYAPGDAHRLTALNGAPAVTLHLSSPPRPEGPRLPAVLRTAALATAG